MRENKMKTEFDNGIPLYAVFIFMWSAAWLGYDLGTKVILPSHCEKTK